MNDLKTLSEDFRLCRLITSLLYTHIFLVIFILFALLICHDDTDTQGVKDWVVPVRVVWSQTEQLARKLNYSTANQIIHFITNRLYSSRKSKDKRLRSLDIHETYCHSVDSLGSGMSLLYSGELQALLKPGGYRKQIEHIKFHYFQLLQL